MPNNIALCYSSSNGKDWRQVRPDLICPLNHMKSLPPQAKKAQFTVIVNEGLEPPVWDKGIGSIIVTYSLIMVFPKLNPIIVDFAAVRRYTRKKDKKTRVVLFHYYG